MTDAPSRPALARPWLRRAILLIIAAVLVVAVLRFLGRLDWAKMVDSLAQLQWWHPIPLLALLVVRQLLSAAPLAFYIPGVSLYRATVNDLGATTMAAFAPAPSDMVLRVAMFTTWGYDTSKALAGTVMNAMTLFIVRFGTPLIGFAVLLVTGGTLGFRLLDLASLLVCAALVVGLLLLVRTDAWAASIGHRLGRIAHRVRRSVDPDAWAAACVRFRGDILARFGYGFPRGIATMCGVVVCDAVMLTLALRFVGVNATTLTVTAILIGFLFAYPLTCFPMQGLGAVDVLILAALVEASGDIVREPALAALVIWRVFTVAGPLLLGLGAVASWRRLARRQRAA